MGELMGRKNISKKLTLKDLSRDPKDRFNRLVRFFEGNWCAVCWDGEFSVIGVISINKDCVKIISSKNEVTYIRIDMIQAISPLSEDEREEAKDQYFETIFKAGWDSSTDN